MSRVLVDRHHAGLLYSLQLLFEDRLKHSVYVPVGHEWWDEGYWRFGQVFGDDRLAQQYLVPNPPWEDLGEGLYRTHDVEFPTRAIFGVSLARAKQMEWSFACASVQENLPGYARFAKEVGSKLVYQVGNNGQRIDWSLDPLVLASAKIDIPGRGVTYHQEFAKDTTFHFSHPRYALRHTITSFVNCFNRIPIEWQRFLDFQQHAPAFEYYVHGHDGPDGLIQPTGKIAVEMARSGWGYHDKPQGDGFGHVIHYWAAIGRPLIGSASYYRGLFAEHLWEDGVTCVDLSVRSTAEAAQLVKEIAADPERHAEMGKAIRNRLDNLVDFDAEERAIRELLGL